jgi:hypothetical protein
MSSDVWPKLAIVDKSHQSLRTGAHLMGTCIDTDALTWSIARTNTCDTPGCWRQPVIMAGGRRRQAFCDLHLAPAADLALQVPAFPGWYHVDRLATSSKGQVTVLSTRSPASPTSQRG